MFIEYLPEQSYIHRLDIRTKLFGFLGIMILAFLFNNPLYNLMVGVLVGALALSIKMPFKRIYELLLPLAPIFVLILLFSSLSYSQGHLALTAAGLLRGCNYIIRIFIMVISSSIVTLTTPIDDFIQLLGKMKIPYEVSFVITTALNFIPTMDKKRMMIMEAQRARGARLEGKGVFRQIKNYIPIMVPMIINSILMANTLAMSMMNRGFGYSRTWTNLREMTLSTRDYLSMLVILLIVISGFYIRFGL